ncbi:hypothetical protein NQT65_18670 [Pseudoalteromonas agarivorans]|uniref:hypothetical protein n=1 Tax=Pseudoalteromonas agarivorans TaxID=176102 RepID=UPI002118B819|nr:hypothetical protein [Pseudoalteromonas agarivorans]MCQ8822217.1 hypothetical protein [Pseudoalteromonas agarivorans]
MDPVSYIGDYSRYYLSFYKPDIHILATGKLYRYSIFNILKFFEMGPQFYTGLSLCLNYFIALVVSLKFAILFSFTSSKKLLFFFLITFISLPSTAIGNFESMLSFSFSYIALYLLCTQRNKAAFIFVIMAPLIHPAAVLYSIMYIPVFLFKNHFYKYKTMFTILLLLGIIGFLFIPLAGVLPFLDHIQRKLITFLTGPWSEYIERRDFEFILIALIKLIVFAFSIYRIRQVYIKKFKFVYGTAKLNDKKEYAIKMLYNVSLYMFPIILLAIFSRTLAERYIYFGMFFFLPVVILATENLKIFINRFFIYSMVFIIFLLPQNIIVFGVLALKSTTQESLSNNMYELLYEEYDKAPPPVGRL